MTSAAAAAPVARRTVLGASGCGPALPTDMAHVEANVGIFEGAIFAILFSCLGLFELSAFRLMSGLIGCEPAVGGFDVA